MDFEGNYKVRHRPRRTWLYLFLIFLITMATIFLFFNHNNNDNERHFHNEKLTALDFRNESITLDDVLGGKFYAKGFNGSFVDSTTLQFFNTNGDFVTFSMETKTTKIIVSNQEFIVKLQYRPFRCDFSPSKKYLLVSYDPQKIYRHSVYALYSVIDLETRELIPISTTLSNNDDLSRRIQLVKWSTSKDALVFVHANDVYLLKNIHGNVERITFDGSHLIYNGVADWVYEEEMFNTNEAVYLHDDENLAFVTFNDTQVDLIQFPVYGGFQYPVIEAIPYPKSGRQNPTATVSIYSNKASKMLQLPRAYIPEDHYIGSVQWTSDKNLLVQILNRYQNNSWVLLCDLNAICDVIHTQEQTSGWLDVKEIYEISESNFVTIETTKQSKYSYKHVVQFSKNSVVKVLSRGDFSVDKILAVSNGDIYFTADDNLHKQTATKTKCLTCNKVIKCKSNEVSMDKKSGEYFVQVCLNGFEDVPVVRIFQTEPLTEIFTLESNKKLKGNMDNVQFPITKRLSFKTENDYSVEIKLFLPFDFDSGRKYPLLIDVYGGPGSTRLNDRFSVDWGISLVSSKNIIYGSIDGRGSGGKNKSDDFIFEIYKRFGTVEVEDQIKGAEYILKALPFVNPEKVAIWGWSYGGFVTSMVMGKDLKNIFKCGISVAPVTNWGFYDTIYTERYMGLPQENLKSYNESDVTNFIQNFKNKHFLLVHGNADDNVHYQQSMYLSRALELGDIIFQQQSYPDENHGLGSVRPHLYHTLEHFLNQNCNF
ncbi:venom dipeptidyl peptidase 4 [Folsomia candida]|uniref:venom dipeptidyl peptidase 4 n=1 Tax=Folsomia candida TaxID=158441 RepID=UPI001605150A|nr:venom dipeptidyl peptidase 4 [Folsomia candida]